MHWCTFLLALAAPVFSAPVLSRQTTTNRALWLWESDLIKDSTKVLDFLSVVTSPDYKISTVYALIDRDMGTPIWDSFVTKCTAAGIAVEALMGDSYWILGKTKDDGPTLQHNLDWIEGYQKNVSANARFAGIHMDVEPWGLDEWATNKEAYIASLLSIVNTVKSFAKPLNLPVAADLPFWANTVACQDATLDTCLLAHLDSVTFMTYRNTAPSLLDVAIPVLKAVDSADPGKPVWLSVETSSDCADANLISYAGKSVGTLMTDLNTVANNVTKEYARFAGIAIHSYSDFVAMGA
jgi:hypothetical protein